MKTEISNFFKTTFRKFTQEKNLFFSGDNAGYSQTTTFIPNNIAKYDPNLIHHLKDDHRELLNSLELIVDHIQIDKCGKMYWHLSNFLSLFNSHLIDEYTKLYVYLDHSYRDQAEQRAKILKYRHDIAVIGKKVRLFCSKWMQAGVDADTIGTFMSEFEIMGKIWVYRIEKEEEFLYSLYDQAPFIAHHAA